MSAGDCDGPLPSPPTVKVTVKESEGACSSFGCTRAPPSGAPSRLPAPRWARWTSEIRQAQKCGSESGRPGPAGVEIHFREAPFVGGLEVALVFPRALGQVGPKAGLRMNPLPIRRHLFPSAQLTPPQNPEPAVRKPSSFRKG